MGNNKGFFAGSAITTQAPARSIPACGACGLYRKCKSPKMEVRGGGGMRVLLVGDVPAKDDDAKGRHWAGAAAKRVAAVLRKAGGGKIDEEFWLTNALACRPTKETSSAEVGYCRPNITKTIKELRPDIIIPMGAGAVNSVLGPVWGEDCGPVSRWVGWRIPSQDLNAWVCPTWHPERLSKEDDPVMDNQFEAHLTAALALSGKPWPEGPPNLADNVRHVTDPQKAAAWLRKCATRQTGAIAWDYETNMLKPDGPDAKIVSCSVAWGRTGPERCIAFPWHGEAITAMQELIKSPIPKIGANLKFEDRWTRKEFGHRVRAWAWDTMLAAHVCDNRRAITSVKFQAFIRCGAPVWNDKIQPFLKTKKDEKVNAILEQITLDDLLRYNGLDAWMEFMVAVDQIRELGAEIPWRIK